jgi:MFS transporter, Spinster family, sphingosine-1-phosphate transporter
LADFNPVFDSAWSPAVGTLVLLIGLNLLNYIDRYILPGEVSLIQREFHSTDQQMGALTTALFSFTCLPRR